MATIRTLLVITATAVAGCNSTAGQRVSPPPSGGDNDSAAPPAADAAPPPAPTVTGSPPTSVDAGPTVPATSSFKLGGVTTWRGDATAAYAIIHDDICDPSTNYVLSSAEPELAKRGLHSGFGVIVSKCDTANAGTWAQVNTLIAHGHDVFSHSLDHPCMTNNAELASSCDPAAKRSTDYAKEITQAGTTLKSKTNVSLDFFIFPYDVCDPAGIARLKSDGYLGARCGTLGTNPPDFADPFASNFDVFGASYSQYFGQGACAKTAKGAAPVQYDTPPADYTPACRQYVLNHYVDDIIAAKGFGTRELHGMDPGDVTNGGWETVPIADYQAHLDYIVAKAKAWALWVDGPTPILKYRFARDTQTCALPTVIGGNTLHFGTLAANCKKYATVLSYRVTTTDGSDPSNLLVKQGSVTLPTRKTGAGQFVVDADPSKGDAVLVRPASD